MYMSVSGLAVTSHFRLRTQRPHFHILFRTDWYVYRPVYSSKITTNTLTCLPPYDVALRYASRHNNYAAKFLAELPLRHGVVLRDDRFLEDSGM
jgi:hypothetical protein